MTIPLTYARFNSILRYDPTTGVLSWRERNLRPGYERLDKGWNTRFKDKPAGRPHRHGHLQVNINYKNYAAHRIAWVLHYKFEPAGNIDHINGNPADNRISNLRVANQSQNMQNSAKRVDNTSGVRGVSWSKQSKKWYAFINKNGRMKSLGYHSRFEDACFARWTAEVKEFGEFARSSSSLAPGDSSRS